MNRFSRPLCVIPMLAALASVACGSTQKESNGSSPVTENGTGGGGSGGGGGGGGGGAGQDAAAAPDNPCGLHTQFGGDDRCILPPEEGKGMQIHIGPTDYDNPDDVWIMQPGDEKTNNYHIYTPNTETVYYYGQQYRMRVGSHHMIVTVSSDTTGPEGWGPDKLNLVSSIGGTQHEVEDFPPGGKVAPEDVGLAREVQPHTPLDIQLHFYNSTEQPTLREVWVNLLFVDPNEVTQKLGMMGGLAAVNVPPHSSKTVTGVCNGSNALLPAGAESERIVSLFGHAHKHNQRFVVYRDKADGTTDTVYDSYDGAEAPQYVYNSIVQNPVADPVNRHSGGLSGQLLLLPTEKLRFECDITNDLNTSLLPTEQVYTGEMCNLFGTVVGVGFPCFKIN